jgi:plasmid stabilization system protein ParE
MKIVWAPLAIERVEEAMQFITRDKPEAGRRWAEQLLVRVEGLTTHPESGRIVPDLDRTDLREIIYVSHRVIYRIVDEEVRILTIRHCARLLDESELEQ